MMTETEIGEILDTWALENHEIVIEIIDHHQGKLIQLILFTEKKSNRFLEPPFISFIYANI